jgi:hypothetical protein
MSGLPWIQLAADWKGHKKAIRLRVFLADEWAWAYVVSLWCWSAQYAGDGILEGPGTNEVIADAAGWKGDPKHFVDCLIRAELLDETEKGYRIHDWEDYAGAHIEKREKERTRLRTYRERTRTKHVRSAYVHGERERETEKETKQLLPPTPNNRADGEAAAAATVASLPRPNPSTLELAKSLREAGKAPVHPSVEWRASVEAAIAEVGVESATRRVLAAWNTGKPVLTFYLEAINGKPAKAKDGRKGMASPSTDFTSPEATTL